MILINLLHESAINHINIFSEILNHEKYKYENFIGISIEWIFWVHSVMKSRRHSQSTHAVSNWFVVIMSMPRRHHCDFSASKRAATRRVFIFFGVKKSRDWVDYDFPTWCSIKLWQFCVCDRPFNESDVAEIFFEFGRLRCVLFEITQTRVVIVISFHFFRRNFLFICSVCSRECS